MKHEQLQFDRKVVEISYLKPFIADNELVELRLEILRSGNGAFQGKIFKSECFTMLPTFTPENLVPGTDHVDSVVYVEYLTHELRTASFSSPELLIQFVTEILNRIYCLEAP